MSTGVRGEWLFPGDPAQGTRYAHGHMPHLRVKATDSAEQRLVAVVFGQRPTKAERRVLCGAVQRVGADWHGLRRFDMPNERKR